MPPETEREGEGSEDVQVKSEPGEQRSTRLSKQAKEETSWKDSRPPPRDVPPSLLPSSSNPNPSSLSSPIRGGVAGGRDTRPSPGGGGRGSNLSIEKATSPSTANSLAAVGECKSEPSDHESCPGDTTSSTTGEEGEDGGARGDTWVQREPQKFAENDRVLVWYGSGKNLETYEAKIIGMEESEDRRDYLVHYSGWNNR